MHMIVYREPEASCHWYCLWYEYQLHLWELSNLIFFSTISLVGRFGVESVPWFFGYIHITTTISAKKKKICTHKCPLRNRGVFVDLEWCVQLLRTRCTGQHHSILPMIPAARSQMPWQALWYLRERYEALAWELITWRPDIQTRLENQEEELFFVVSMMKAMLLDLFLSVALKGRCCLSVIVTYNSRYHA